MNIQLVSIFVDDPHRAFKFYTEVLGFVPRMYVPEADLAIVTSPEDPHGTGLLLEPNGNPIAKAYQDGVYQAGLPVIVFGSADVEQEYQRLKGLGVAFRQEPTKTEYGTVAIFEDTLGNLIQIHQM